MSLRSIVSRLLWPVKRATEQLFAFVHPGFWGTVGRLALLTGFFLSAFFAGVGYGVSSVPRVKAKTVSAVPCKACVQKRKQVTGRTDSAQGEGAKDGPEIHPIPLPELQEAWEQEKKERSE